MYSRIIADLFHQKLMQKVRELDVSDSEVRVSEVSLYFNVEAF